MSTTGRTAGTASKKKHLQSVKDDLLTKINREAEEDRKKHGQPKSLPVKNKVTIP